MLLAIDIGNTNVTLGLYDKDKLAARWRFSTGREKMADEYGALLLRLFSHSGIAVEEIRAAVIASVVPTATGAVAEACRRFVSCEPMIVDASVKTGIRILYDDPDKVGSDRIVDVAAAYKFYGGPACIIDFGTATTFDAVSECGDYLGGAITPGIRVAAEALFQRASKLPKVDLVRPPAAVGRNLVHSLQSGILLGYVGLVEGVIGRFRAELGDGTKVIATGGLAEMISRETNAISILAPWLTLDGLRIIYDLNR
jgi:type III pantothenate kinase